MDPAVCSALHMRSKATGEAGTQQIQHFEVRTKTVIYLFLSIYDENSDLSVSIYFMKFAGLNGVSQLKHRGRQQKSNKFSGVKTLSLLNRSH